MEELDIAAITKRSIHGVFALVSRTFFIGIFNLIITVLLAAYLSPAVFGVYALVTAAIAFLQYFSDIGLAGALIQKKEKITQEDLSTTFFIQQGLVIAAVGVAYILSPFLVSFYHLDTLEMYLLLAIIASFFISSLKTIPSVLLERELQFEKLVVPQVVETIVFGCTILMCAIMGFGVTSFTYAVLARGIAGLIAIYIISPWKPQFHFSKAVAKKLLSFGVPFQMNSFLALIKDDLFFAYVGKVLPLTQLGYITFAQKWAFTPLRLIMDNVIRITFSSFSRLQHERNHLGRAIEKSLFVLMFLILPALAGLVILAPLFIHLIPRYQKWEPALFSLFFFALNAALSSVSTPLTNALNAIGKIKISLYLMIFWTIATWALTPLALFIFGFNGFAIASAIIAISVVGVVALAKKYITFDIVVILPPVCAAIIMIGCMLLLRYLLPTSWIAILGIGSVGIVTYMGSLILIDRKQVFDDLNMLKDQFVR